jgi:hypothetical protein
MHHLMSNKSAGGKNQPSSLGELTKNRREQEKIHRENGVTGALQKIKQREWKSAWTE